MEALDELHNQTTIHQLILSIYNNLAASTRSKASRRASSFVRSCHRRWTHSEEVFWALVLAVLFSRRSYKACRNDSRRLVIPPNHKRRSRRMYVHISWTNQTREADWVIDWVLQKLHATSRKGPPNGNIHISIGILGLGQAGDGWNQEWKTWLVKSAISSGAFTKEWMPAEVQALEEQLEQLTKKPVTKPWAHEDLYTLSALTHSQLVVAGAVRHVALCAHVETNTATSMGSARIVYNGFKFLRIWHKLEQRRPLLEDYVEATRSISSRYPIINIVEALQWQTCKYFWSISFKGTSIFFNISYDFVHARNAY
jgi:hypothetical protein